MLAVLHHWAVRKSLLSGASNETSSGCSRSSGNMSSVRRGYSADSEAGVRPGCLAQCSKLARMEIIWVLVTDSTVDSGSTSACLPHQIPRSPSLRLLAVRMGAARSATTSWLARTGTTVGSR